MNGALRWIAAAAGVGVLAWLVLGSRGPSGDGAAPTGADHDAAAGALSAEACPADAPPAALAYTLKDMDDRPVSLADFKGKVVLLDFWATWCGPCKVEMPHLVKLYEKYKGAGFVLLGVNVDEDPKAAVALAERLGVTFPVLFDADKSVSRLYALDSMPATVLIDRDGRVRHLHRGYRDGVEATYERQVRELVKE
jgi:thiol-disulfide isomerase/thioredoxin